MRFCRRCIKKSGLPRQQFTCRGRQQGNNKSTDKRASTVKKPVFHSLNLSLIEACYLLEKGRLDIYEEDVECSIGYLIDILKEQDNYAKYIVYRDLKDRGYVIKTGFKYGSDFRLYDRGRSPGKGHSDFLVKIVYENFDINVLDFSSYVRVSHGVNKKLLLAIVDDDFDITYYNVEWTRP